MHVIYNKYGYVIKSKEPPLRTFEEMNRAAIKYNNPSLAVPKEAKSFGLDFTEIIVAVHYLDLIPFGAKVSKDHTIYFDSKDEAENALMYLEGVLVVQRLQYSK